MAEEKNAPKKIADEELDEVDGGLSTRPVSQAMQSLSNIMNNVSVGPVSKDTQER